MNGIDWEDPSTRQVTADGQVVCEPPKGEQAPDERVIGWGSPGDPKVEP